MPQKSAFRGRKPFRAPAASTSWERVSDWYADYLTQPGAIQHDVVFPGTLALLAPRTHGHYLDLACGEGSFSRLLIKRTPSAHLTGVDASPSLIQRAKKLAPQGTTYLVGDATRLPTTLATASFDGASCLLAIQNIENLPATCREVARLLKPGAPFVIVMNHPCFRQPRQSGWGWDEQRKLQYRRVDRYLSSYEMPILAHPGSAPSVQTSSFHRPLSSYISALAAAHLSVDGCEEWISNKTSDSGPRAKAENVARAEIPLFLALRARKM
jgi:ubiquinone/menaquinone biosynthesis C-methylase UbiE